MRFMIALVLPLVVVGAVSVRAEEDSAEKGRAKQLYQEGEKFYAAGDYAHAIDRYQRAYGLVPLPLLLFDLGQAYRLNKQSSNALEAYRKFLDVQPNGPGATEAKERIAEMKAEAAAEAKRVEAQEKLATQQAEDQRVAQAKADAEREAATKLALEQSQQQPSATQSDHVSRKRTWIWGVVGGVVVVGLAVGLGVGLGTASHAPSPSYGSLRF